MIKVMKKYDEKRMIFYNHLEDTLKMWCKEKNKSY